MKFNCITCNYETDFKFNYQKHLETKKHIEKSKLTNKVKPYQSCIDVVSIINIPKKEENICNFCHKAFTNAGNLGRHYKSCVKRNSLESNYENELKTLKSELAHVKELYNKEKTENATLKSLVNDAGSIIKTSISTTNYIIKHFK